MSTTIDKGIERQKDKEQKAIEMMGNGDWLDAGKDQEVEERRRGREQVECENKIWRHHNYVELHIMNLLFSKNTIAHANREGNRHDCLFNDHPIKGFEHRTVLGTQI